MGSHQINRLSLKLAALVLVAVALIAGCSRTPLGVENEPTESTEPTLLSRAPQADGSPSFSPVPMYAEQVIPTATGGELSLLDVTLSVPVKAVDNDTLFSILIPDPNVFYNEFGTDGLVFSRPVTVTMSYRDADLTGVNESTIRIGWLNETTGHFHDIECVVDFESKTVTGTLDHFSAYGLISD